MTLFSLRCKHKHCKYKHCKYRYLSPLNAAAKPKYPEGKFLYLLCLWHSPRFQAKSI